MINFNEDIVSRLGKTNRTVINECEHIRNLTVNGHVQDSSFLFATKMISNLKGNDQSNNKKLHREVNEPLWKLQRQLNRAIIESGKRVELCDTRISCLQTFLKLLQADNTWKNDY
jgi:hypothetical protein